MCIRDRHIPLKKEDFAVGLELSVTALILFITECVNYTREVLQNAEGLIADDDKFLSIPWITFFLLVGLWGCSTLIRKKGWKDADNLDMKMGIIIPNIYGLIILIFVVNWIK